MQLSFENRTSLVTGGGSGIGKGAAVALAGVGANVMLVGRNADRLAAVAGELSGAPGQVRYEPADHTIGPITQIDSELWRSTVDLNVNGTMYVLKHAAREMVRGGGGAFVGISSIAASNTHRWFGAYGPAKSALDALIRLAADELGPSWVRVNGIRPGLTRTDMVEPLMQLPEALEDYRQCTPLPRVGEVEDIANLALFLLSDAGNYITGQIINVDGGHGLRRGPDISAMLEPAFGADGLRGVV